MCPCGSGRKFKKCHVDTWDSITKFRKNAFQSKNCLYPGDSPCTATAIQSHTIPRRGSLARISEGGHVIGFAPESGQPPTGRIIAQRVGLSKASTFTGFCASHDKNLFAPLEDAALVPTTEQAFLLALRPLARESWAKAGMVRTLDMVDHFKLNGPYASIMRTVRQGAVHGLHDFEASLGEYSKTFQESDYGRVRFYAVLTDDLPTVMCSVAVQPEVDFAGHRILVPGALRVAGPSTFVAFNIVATDVGGAIVFSWLDPSPAAEQLVETFATLPDSDIATAAIRFAIEFSDNTFCSPVWWNSIGTDAQEALVERFVWTANPTNMRRDDALSPDGLQLASWSVAKRVSGVPLKRA